MACGFEYDFIVAPGADPRAIAMAVDGADQVSLDVSGDLILRTTTGVVRQHAPYVYQEVGGSRHEIASRFTILDAHDARSVDGLPAIGFELGAYESLARS